MTVNMFKALRIEQNEVMMCRFLADLLDPKGWHGLGTQFLKSFLEKVIQLEGLECLERTCVMTEYLIDNGKRIGIMHQSPAFSVPTEVKIDARDRQRQCDRENDRAFCKENGAARKPLHRNSKGAAERWRPWQKSCSRRCRSSSRARRDRGSSGSGKKSKR